MISFSSILFHQAVPLTKIFISNNDKKEKKPHRNHLLKVYCEQTIPTLIFLSELGAFSCIILEPLMSQSLSSSPCRRRKGQLIDGISLSIRAAAPISCMPNDTRMPPWKFSSSASYASTWQEREKGKRQSG